MTEHKKIRLTKDLPWAKAGEEFEVFDDSYISIDIAPKRFDYKIYLSEIEGWYEVVRWKPRMGQGYNYVNSKGQSDYRVWKNSPEDNDRFSVENCFEDHTGGRNQTEAIADKIRKVFKGEI